jgi:hypothetical protein
MSRKASDDNIQKECNSSKTPSVPSSHRTLYNFFQKKSTNEADSNNNIGTTSKPLVVSDNTPPTTNKDNDTITVPEAREQLKVAQLLYDVNFKKREQVFMYNC